ENAQALAEELNAPAYALDELHNYKEGFDVMITCTGAPRAIIDGPLYESLLAGETDKKIVIDLAVPNDLDQSILGKYPIHYIEVSDLQAISQTNIKERYGELEHAEMIIQDNIQELLPLIQQRHVEVTMREVPDKIKEIRALAINEVFAHNVDNLDPQAREVLE